MSNAIDLTDFVPIPHRRSYLIHPDGRVYSLRTDRILAEIPGTSLVWRRVSINGSAFRVRDLVSLIFGSTYELEMRTDEEYERIYQDRERHRMGLL